MSEDQAEPVELTDEQAEFAAEMILWFRQAVAKLGGDKEPDMSVGQGWLTSPLYHIAPDDAMEADWSEGDPTHIVFARRTDLDDGKVLLFHEWYHDEAHNYPDLVELVNEAMGHEVANEDWSKADREETSKSSPEDDAEAEDE